MNNALNILIPMSGVGTSFIEAGYSLPKPLVDVDGMPMIERVIANLKPKTDHKFIFVVLKEHYERYPLAEIFDKTTNGNFEVVILTNVPQGAACTALTAIDHINNDAPLMVCNADQIVDIDINDFITFSEKSGADGTMITFEASHPKWSFARTNKNFEVIETAEKRVISNHATSGIYYYKKGNIFVNAILQMIEKDIRFNNDFYICPAFNEIILAGGKVLAWEIEKKQMHSMGQAVDLAKYLHFIETSYNQSNENHHPNGRKGLKVQSTRRQKPRIQKTKTAH